MTFSGGVDKVKRKFILNNKDNKNMLQQMYSVGSLDTDIKAHYKSCLINSLI